MNTYKVKIQVEAEIQAFNEDDAADYINDIFGTDEEVKSIKISSIKEK
jgi:hypothetical protein